MSKEMRDLFNEARDVPVLIFGRGAVRDINECIKNYSGDLMDNILTECFRCNFTEKCGLYERLIIAKDLRDHLVGFPIIIELEFLKNGLTGMYSFIDLLEDTIVSMIEDNPLLIIIPESPGSITEFNLYYESKLRKRIRLIVKYENNPLYREKFGFLSARYMAFLAEVGYLFVYWKKEQLPLLIRRIVEAEIKKFLIDKEKFNNKKE